MKKRIIVSLLMLVILLPFLFLTDTWLFVILISFLSGRAVFEMFRCLGIHKIYFVSVPAMVLASLSPFAARYFGTDTYLRYAVVVTVLTALWMFGVFTFSDGAITLEQTGTATAMMLYITCGFSFLILMCDIEKYGFWLMLSVFVVSWMTDIFAYFTGMLFGKHKLIPKISPKKTVEGAIGGIVFCVAALIVYGICTDRYLGIKPDYIMLSLAGLAASVVSQIGDLLMSSVKRSRNIKDYGKLLPGHGGILDRFDSVLAVSVIMFAAEIFFKLYE